MAIEKVLLVSSYSRDCAGGIVTWTGNFLDSNWTKNKNILFLNLYSSRRSKKRKIRSALRDYRKILKFKKMLREEKPDLVHINFGGSTLGLIRDSMMANYALKHGYKVFMECHCDANAFYQNKPSVKTLRKVYSSGVKFLVLNPQSATYLKHEIGVKDKDIAQVPNFVPAQTNHCTIGKSVKHVLFVGHVRKAKGVDLIYSLAKEYPDIVFTFVGPDFHDVEKPNLENVVFTGELKKEQALEHMLCSDLLLLPSISEGLPMVILEAMSVGLPVIASAVGNLPEVLSNTNAGLFPPGSYSEFFATFKRYVENFNLRVLASDSELAKFASTYESEKALAQMESAYSD